MKTVNHLLFGNHPKAGKLKARAAAIVKIIKESGGRIEAKDLEQKLGISRVGSPSMFYKPLAAMRKWNLVQTNKTVLDDGTGKKRTRTEYELTPKAFYDHIQNSLAESAKKDIESL